MGLYQVLMYMAAGAIGTAAHYITLYGLLQHSALDMVPASSLGALAGAGVNYVILRWCVFSSQLAHFIALPRFVFIVVTGLMLNATVLALSTHYLDLLLSQLLATGVLFLWGYIGHRYWSFREINPTTSQSNALFGFAVNQRCDTRAQ